jgi:hypothetical protein
MPIVAETNSSHAYSQYCKTLLETRTDGVVSGYGEKNPQGSQEWGILT